MNKLLRIAAAAAVSASLVTGLAAAESGGSISNTGPDSTNKIINKNSDRLSVRNDNDVNVRNSNDQNATTGEAEVEDNTTGGDATSGNASNSNSLDASVTVDNSAGLANMSFGGSGSSGGSIDTTGPDSHNIIVNKSSTSVRINNDNDINICNTNTQNATSGEASVEHNTTGGSATSGDATNTNSSTFSVSVTN